MCHAGPDLRIEPTCLLVGCSRGFEQSAVPADVREASKQLRIIAADPSPAKQAHHGFLCAPEIGFQLSIKMVRHRKIRTELQSALKSILRPH